MEIDRRLLERLYKQVEIKLGQGEGSLWTNKQFLQLSEQIFAQTGVLVSASTLKRMFGKVKTDADYVPQLETRNALAEFCGHNNWHSFVEHQKQKAPVRPNPKPIKVSPWFISIAFSVLLVIIIGIGFLTQPNKPNIQWECLKQEGVAPFSCVFKYSVPKNLKSPVLLLIEKDTVVLDPKLTTYTHYFKLPGFVKAALSYEGKKIGEKEILVLSNGWKAYAFRTAFTFEDVVNILPASFNSTQIYLSPADSFISPATVKEFGIDINQPFWTEYRNYGRFDIPLDTFSFEAFVQNNSKIPTVLCNHIAVNIIGTNGKIRLYFVKPGCSRWLLLQFGDKEYNGRDNDLESLAMELDSHRHLTLQVSGNFAKVMVDQKTVFSTPFNNRLGKLRGVQFDFMGCGRFEGVVVKGKGKQWAMSNEQ